MLQAEQVLQGRYKLKQQLGQNPGRQTWLAYNLEVSPPELVIVKLLAFNPQMQWDEFKLFEREAQVLKQLNHPRIPRYRDYFSLDKEAGAGLFWFGLVQQYIPGTCVRQLLNQGKRFTETEVQKIATDVLEILIYLHGLNPPVLHRDIKPSNLILGNDEQVYLVDFGAVQDTAATEGITFTVVGTTGYAPLEQFWGKTVPASDLYALGATLIHLLTGTAPADLPSKDLRIQFRDRISVNPRLVRWIEGLTEPDLEQRFTQATEALTALRTDRYPKTTSRSTLSQPIGSRIRLKKSPERLSITIPKPKRSLTKFIAFIAKIILTAGFLPFMVISILIILVLVPLLFYSLNYGFGVAILTFILIVVMSSIVAATNKELARVQNEISEALRTLFGQQHIEFCPDTFVMECRMLGLSYLRQVANIADIKNVQEIPFEKIAIQVKGRKYFFGKELTESERCWLTQEIKDWLSSTN
jgi:serine/threonine protein kinase